MMLLAEIAREEGLFDWLAAVATSHASGSPRRLFLLIYGVGTVVTIFLSNDATAVVLTPAVAAAVKAAKAKEPLPYLLICAFIANAASFVLPISNPANLVIYGSRMPPLAAMAAGLSPAVGHCHRCHLSAAALHPARRAPARDRRGGATVEADRRRKDGGGRDRGHCWRAACRLGARPPARAADRDRRQSHRACGPDPRPQMAVEHRRRIFRGACCRWSPDCSCWWKHWARPA